VFKNPEAKSFKLLMSHFLKGKLKQVYPLLHIFNYHNGLTHYSSITTDKFAEKDSIFLIRGTKFPS